MTEYTRSDSLSIPNAINEIEQLRKKKMVKIIPYVVPSTISSSTITLYDVRVNCKQGKDEEIYAKNPNLKKYVPKGTTYFSIENIDENNKSINYVDFLIFGLPKFGGASVEEDYENQESYAYSLFTEPKEKATKIISIEKMNGEAAHFAGRYINGVFYLIAGSKHTHILFNSEAHIDQYSEPRFDLAKKISKVVLKYWNNLDIETKKNFTDFLDNSKSTIICEYLQKEYQHIVSLDHLTENKLVAFAIATPFKTNSSEAASLSYLTPEKDLETLKSFKLKTPRFEVVEMQKENKAIERIRGMYNTEGYVFYYVKDSGKTVGLLKVKTIWYVLLRVIREKTIYFFLNKNSKKSASLAQISMCKRFDNLRPWLKLTDLEVNHWTKLSKGWFEWMEEEKLDNSCVKFRANFTKYWASYLSISEQTDEYVESIPGGAASSPSSNR